MVVLTLKNLQQQTFTVDIDMSSTVQQLKEKIEKEKGADYPANGQKLIYAGKILQDDSVLSSYNIDDKKFLVIMVTKPKAPPPSGTIPSPTIPPQEAAAPAADTPAQSSASSESRESAAAPAAPAAPAAAPAEAPAAEPAPASAGSAESVLVMGEEFNRMVENIMEMGYARPEVERALRASFNNPYTAVQYLVDGIPSNLEQDAAAPAAAAAPGGGGGGGAPPAALAAGQPAEGLEEGDDADPLSFLRAQPQFEQMRQVIRSNPNLLNAFIQQIGQTNPQLLDVIQENQEEFIRMLNEGGPGGNVGGGGGGGDAPGVGGGRGGGAPGQNAIMVSPQDRDAIERLKALGNFPEDVVIQAYFACEKNENLAAEFLFSQSWD